MKLHKRHVAWIALIVCAAGVAGVMTARYVKSESLIPTHMQAVIACAEDRDPVGCARPHIRELVRVGESAAVVDALDAGRVAPASCHFLAHLVGQETYRLTESSEIAISQCSRACGSGCVHGAIGEAFVQEAGISVDSLSAGHLGHDELVGVGKRLCQSSTACHGVGHALLQRSSVSLSGIEESLRLCRSIASGQRVFDCYSGIYMEYSDTLASRSVWDDDARELTQDSLPALCDRESAAESRACFLYFPTIVHEVMSGSGSNESQEVTRDRVASVCLRLENQVNQTACLYGLGASYFQSVIAGDLDTVLRRCDGLPDSSGAVTCVLGAALMTLEYRENRSVITYCAAIPKHDLRQLCYRSVFSHIQLAGGSVEEARSFCPAKDTGCYESASTYAATTSSK